MRTLELLNVRIFLRCCKQNNDFFFRRIFSENEIAHTVCIFQLRKQYIFIQHHGVLVP